MHSTCNTTTNKKNAKCTLCGDKNLLKGYSHCPRLSCYFKTKNEHMKFFLNMFSISSIEDVIKDVTKFDKKIRDLNIPLSDFSFEMYLGKDTLGQLKKLW